MVAISLPLFLNYGMTTMANLHVNIVKWCILSGGRGVCVICAITELYATAPVRLHAYYYTTRSHHHTHYQHAWLIATALFRYMRCALPPSYTLPVAILNVPYSAAFTAWRAFGRVTPPTAPTACICRCHCRQCPDFLPANPPPTYPTI